LTPLSHFRFNPHARAGRDGVHPKIRMALKLEGLTRDSLPARVEK